ncbi:hypothetical protein X975_00333, partial [Stegodyphus mimosarum]
MQMIRTSAQTQITRACGATSKRYLRLEFQTISSLAIVFFLRFFQKKPRSIIPRSKQRSSFDQVSEFDRGRIVAYRECGLSFREIGSRVGRNQTTVMRICDRWMREGTMDRCVQSHPPQCTTSCDDRNIVRMAVTDRSVTSRTTAHSVCNASYRVCAYHSTLFTAEWFVRKTSIASSTLDAEPQTSRPPMVRRKKDVDGRME